MDPLAQADQAGRLVPLAPPGQLGPPEGPDRPVRDPLMSWIRRTWERISSIHPALYALSVVALVTWMIAVTLFVAMVRNKDHEIDIEALDGTAFTLLSAIIALWAGFGVWASRSSVRVRFLVITLVALSGIAIITGVSMLTLAFTGEPFSIPSNVAQLLILVTTALVSVAGTSVGYSRSRFGGPEFGPPGEEPYEEPPDDPGI